MALLGADYITYNGGLKITVYGTSASSPVFAGMVSLVNAARLAAGKSALGWLNPALYALSSNFILNDITSGHNKCTDSGLCCLQGFTAATGWDPVTGLGSVILLILSLLNINILLCNYRLISRRSRKYFKVFRVDRRRPSHPLRLR